MRYTGILRAATVDQNRQRRGVGTGSLLPGAAAIMTLYAYVTFRTCPVPKE
jgi:hypothetical protein